MLSGEISHDKVTRFLSARAYTPKYLLRDIKAMVRQIEPEDGVLIFDDTIQEKGWTDENELVYWHYDHTKGRSVKGINLLKPLHHSGDVLIPVAFKLVKKPVQFCDLGTWQVKQSSDITKNEQMLKMIATFIDRQSKFRYVLMDSCFEAKENFEYILKKKYFISVLKDKRLVALFEEDKKKGRFISADILQLKDKQSVRGWHVGFDQEVLVVRRVFTNKDGSKGLLNLVCSDLTLTGEIANTAGVCRTSGFAGCGCIRSFNNTANQNN